MPVDTIRALFTYLIAFTVVIGGGAILYGTHLDTVRTDLPTVVAGFIGSALTFVFSAEVQTRTARQSAASTLAAQPSSNGHAPATAPATTPPDPAA